jgi:hypothetical protein
MKSNLQSKNKMNSHIQQLKNLLLENFDAFGSQLVTFEDLCFLLSPYCTFQESVSPDIMFLELLNKKYFDYGQDSKIYFKHKSFFSRTNPQHQRILCELSSKMKEAFESKNYFHGILHRIECFIFTSRQLPKDISSLKEIITNLCTFTVTVHVNSLIESLVNEKILVSDSVGRFRVQNNSECFKRKRELENESVKKIKNF